MRGVAVAAAIIASTAAWADGPEVPEVIETLVREAHQLTGTGVINTEPEHAVSLFLANTLYDLGVHMPQNEDSGQISVDCEPFDTGWTCRLIFGISWSDAESSHMLEFVLDPRETGCITDFMDIYGDYGVGCWTVRDGQVTFHHFG